MAPGPSPQFACHQCGYSLDGIAPAGAGRCPECGFEYQAPPRAIVPMSNSWRALLHTAGPCLLVVGAMVVLSQVRAARNAVVWPLSIVWFVLLLWSVFLVPWSAGVRLADRHAIIPRRRAFRWRVAGVGWFVNLLTVGVGHNFFDLGSP